MTSSFESNDVQKTFFAQGNLKLQNNQFKDAIRLYVQALQNNPGLASIVSPNLERAKRKYRKERDVVERQKVAVCGWELAHNCAGRVYTLAMIYKSFTDVEIIGSIFPKWGSEIWEPIRITPISKHFFIVKDEKLFLDQAIELVIAHPYDIIHLSKPRAPNIFFGILYKLIWGSKVLMDIDDEELAFVNEDSPISIDEYIQKNGKFPRLNDLAGKDWTRIAVGLAKEFDGLTVCNVALQKRYGGDIIRHARDEDAFITALSNGAREEKRRIFGVSAADVVVIFLGTVRVHKGLVEIACAIREMGRNDVFLAVSNSFNDLTLRKVLQEILGKYLIIFPSPSFDELPEWMCAGDICALWQSPDYLAAKFQTPAKLSDALGAGLQIVASDVEALKEFKNTPGITVTSYDSMPVGLAMSVNKVVTAVKSREPEGLKIFEREFSVQANSNRLIAVINSSSNSNKKILDDEFFNLSSDSFLNYFLPRSQGANSGCPDTKKCSNKPDLLNKVWPYDCSEEDLLQRIRAYSQYKKYRKSRVVVYTAVINAYDSIVHPELIISEWDYVVFYDKPLPEELGESVFDFRLSPFFSENPSLVARWLKTHPHILFPEYEIAIWVDPNILVRGSHLSEAVNSMQIKDIPIYLNPHPDRHCVYEELEACIRLEKDDVITMTSQVDRYKAAGFPENFGMFETGIILRNNLSHEVINFNECWWSEIISGSIRDQLSITWVLRLTGIRFEILPNMKNIRHHDENPYCLFGHSSKKKANVISYHQPDFMRNKNTKIANVVNLREESFNKLLPQINDFELEAIVNNWREASKRSIKKAVVYTAIVNNYDVLKIPEHLNPEWDYVCFSDRAVYPGNHPWQIRPLSYIDSDPTRTARQVKINPHLYFSEYEYSIWVDAHILIKNNYLDNLLSAIDLHDNFFAITHPKRNCSFIEASVCIDQLKDDPELIHGQMSRYKENGFPINLGLIESQVLLRRHNNDSMIKLARLWWREVMQGSRRDQLSLMYCLWKLDIVYKPLLPKEFSTRNHSAFSFFQHGLNWSKRYSEYRVPSFLPREYVFYDQPFWLSDQSKFNRKSLDKFSDMPVDIVICVHNALEDVKKCIQSVLSSLTPSQSIYIVDDGSDCDTRQWLKTIALDLPSIILIRNEIAIGYTKSANIGMRAGKSPFLVLLNSDTIVSNNWTSKLLQVAFSSPNIAVVGPLSNAASWQSVPLLRDPKTKKMAVNELPDLKSESDMDYLCERYGFFNSFIHVPLVNGFCYGIKREVIDAIGYFDEKAFPRGYGEEDDFSIRALDAGYINAIATHCYVYHAKSKSFGGDARVLLAEAGGKVLRQRHSSERVSRLMEIMKQHPILKKIRRDFCLEYGIFSENINDKLSAPAQSFIGQVDHLLELNSRSEVKAETMISKVHNNVNSPLKTSSLKIGLEEKNALSLSSISREELRRNYAHVQQNPKYFDRINVALWIVPITKNILAGGIRTIFMAAQDFSATWGTVNYIVLYQTTTKDRSVDPEIIHREFPLLKFEFIYHRSSDDIEVLPESDIAICTSWPTAYLLARYSKCNTKFYFMQDYETLFYPASTISGIIDLTYTFGFYCIANTKGIGDKYRQFSSRVMHFLPGIDRAIFRPASEFKSKSNLRGELRVVFYARPEKERNGFVSCVEALRIVKEFFGEKVSIFAVGSDFSSDDFGADGIFHNLGQLATLKEVAELYASCHVGLVLMLTPHPSYQPLEYMSCGCATVTNRNVDTQWLFKDGENCVLSTILPNDLAQSIIDLLLNENLRNHIVQGGFSTIDKMSWDNAFDSIRKYVLNPISC